MKIKFFWAGALILSILSACASLPEEMVEEVSAESPVIEEAAAPEPEVPLYQTLPAISLTMGVPLGEITSLVSGNVAELTELGQDPD